MLLQSGLSDCGAAATANALQALGISAELEAVAALADTTADGTTATGVKRAARSFGARVDRLSETDVTRAWLMLHAYLSRGWAAVLAFDAGEHWVTAVGALGERVVVVDPAAVKRPMVTVLGRDEVVRDWRNGRELYAVLVGRRP